MTRRFRVWVAGVILAAGVGCAHPPPPETQVALVEAAADTLAAILAIVAEAASKGECVCPAPEE